MRTECELCSEKDSLEFNLPPCDFCPYNNVKENFNNEEVKQYEKQV